MTIDPLVEKSDENPLLIQCFGLPEDKIRNVGLVRSVAVVQHHKFVTVRCKTVEAFNDEIGHWQVYGIVDYLDKCPICGKLIRVQAVKGTTYLACCSKECYEKYELKNSKDEGD